MGGEESQLYIALEKKRGQVSYQPRNQYLRLKLSNQELIINTPEKNEDLHESHIHLLPEHLEHVVQQIQYLKIVCHPKNNCILKYKCWWKESSTTAKKELICFSL